MRFSVVKFIKLFVRVIENTAERDIWVNWLPRVSQFNSGQVRWSVSQAAACDGLVYSVNLNGQNSGTQGYALPLFED